MDSYRHALAEARRESENLTLALDEHIQRSFGEADKLLLNARDLILLGGGLETMGARGVDRLLAVLSERAPQVRRMTAIAASGRVFGLSHHAPETLPDVSDREFFGFHAGSASPDLLVGRTIVSRVDGRWFVPLTRRIDQPDGSFGGIVGAVLEPEYFRDIYTQLSLGERAFVAVFRNDGTLLFSHPFAESYLGQNLSNWPVVQQVMRLGQAESFEGALPVDGSPRLITFRKLATLPLIVAVGLSRDEVIAAWRRGRLDHIIVAGVMLASLALLLVLLLRQIRQGEDRDFQLFLSGFSIDHAADLALWIGLDGRLVHANATALARCGYADKEVTALRVSDLLPAVDSDVWAKLVVVLRLHGKSSTESEILTRSGERIPVDMGSHLVELENRSCIYLSCRDISDRKRAESELAALNQSLEHQVRVRTSELQAANTELESFSYSVSHDLRTPLRAINGYALMLQEDWADRLDEKAQDYLRRLRTASVRMGDLIDALLGLSRVSRHELRRIDVNLSRMAREIAKEVQDAEPQRRADVVVADGLRVEADLMLVRVLMQNLLGNAWKYTARRDGARIEVGANAAQGETVFFVRDNGAGFDMAFAHNLFGTFQRLHDASEFEGLGIGLATVRRIVARHGGRIWAESAVGQGATFHFTLAPARADLVSPA